MNVLCISGFLGSGKTTVLLELAQAMVQGGADLVVVENEIGEIGVDGGFVREQGLPVRELLGGCICCTLKAGLVDTLRDVERSYEPDWVLVEPTGLAAPRDFLRLVRENLPEIGAIRVVTVVDAPRWHMLLEVLGPLVTAQLETADVVAVNKIDDLSCVALKAVEASIAELAGTAVVLRIAGAQRIGIEPLVRALL
jgi:G3E family GTPase